MKHEYDHSWYDCDICTIEYIQRWPEAIPTFIEYLYNDLQKARLGKGEIWRIWILFAGLKKLTQEEVKDFKISDIRGENIFPDLLDPPRKPWYQERGE